MQMFPRIHCTMAALWEVECCSGSGHTVRDGGSHINIVVVRKKATGELMSAHDFWLDGKKRPPRALAVMCDRCLAEGREPFFVAAKDSDEGPIYRIPIMELGDWEY